MPVKKASRWNKICLEFRLPFDWLICMDMKKPGVCRGFGQTAGEKTPDAAAIIII